MDVGFLGFGYAVPERVRTNDDPLFAELRQGAQYQGVSESDLFTGMKERRVLDEGVPLESLMVEAAQRALVDADLPASRMERLYGYASWSEYLSPNGLYHVHHALGLSPSALVVPVNSDFTNFLLSSVLAREAILSGRCRQVMVCVGSSWTRNVDYANAHAPPMGDAAGAAIVGPSEHWVIVDHRTETLGGEYHTMSLKPRPRVKSDRPERPDEGLRPTFRINEDGIKNFLQNGMRAPQQLVLGMLAAHGLTPADVALIGHQTSRKLMDAWAEAIKPREYPQNFERYGNMTSAAGPVLLAEFREQFTAPYVVYIALGLGSHFSVLLLRR